MPHTRDRIDCRQLKDLYLNKRLSLLEIGRRLGYASRTIDIRAKECKIKLRNPGRPGPKINNEKLESLYIRKRLSSRKIAKIYNCAYSTIDTKIKKLGLPTRTLASAHITTKRANFLGDLKEKAYLLGFRIGDLRVRKMYKNSETILVDCGSTKPEQIKLIERLFKKYGRVWISKPGSSGKTQIECGVNNSFSFLLRRYKKFPKSLLKNKEVFLYLLAGFIDAEGSFFVYHNNKICAFSLGNYNLEILRQIKQWLDKSKFKNRLFKSYLKGYRDTQGYVRNSDYWILSITKKLDLYRFTNMIRSFLKHKGKIRDATRVIRNIDERNVKYGYIGMRG